MEAVAARLTGQLASADGAALEAFRKQETAR
jgi:hypothetical protein